MDENEYRQALIAYLSSQQNQNDGNNYGYMSSMPLASNPARSGARGAAQAGLGAVMLGAAGAMPWFAAPVVGALGVANMGEGGVQAYDAYQQMQGNHPDQRTMDAYVRAMNQTKMGPR